LQGQFKTPIVNNCSPVITWYWVSALTETLLCAVPSLAATSKVSWCARAGIQDGGRLFYCNWRSLLTRYKQEHKTDQAVLLNNYSCNKMIHVSQWWVCNNFSDFVLDKKIFSVSY